MSKKTLKFLSLFVFTFVIILVGCVDNNETMDSDSPVDENGEAIMSTGTLYLAVNPEIAIDYDKVGLVTGVRGVNPAGEEVIENYTDYIGKESSRVLEELILHIGQAGYFKEEGEGESKNIVIELEPGSALPGDNFLEKMAASAQRAVEEYQTQRTENSETGQTIERSGTPSVPATVTYEENTLLPMDEAKQKAFEHAGVQADQVSMDDQEVDTEDGVPVYEFEFHVGPNEYDYVIHGLTGAVLEFEQDIVSTEFGPQTQDFISLEEAKQIAFDHAGVDGTQARFDDAERDEDDGVPYYSLEFTIEESEYEYDIHAITGEVLDADLDSD